MTKFGYPKSYLKDGKLHGVTLLGISKEEVLCPLQQLA
jgi:hypothetical protein